jgi:membrane-associated phospholipid phosphatase
MKYPAIGFFNVMRLFSMFLSLSTFCGCSTLDNGRGWGQDATLFPGWDKAGKSAYNALVSPLTWVPIAGAAIVQIDNWDHRIAKWASDKTPVFGSQANADKWSDYLVYTSGALYGTTALLTPSRELPDEWTGKRPNAGEWIIDKTKGLVVGGAALGLSVGVVQIANKVVNRIGPGGDKYCFPSGHATAPAALSTLAAKNIATMQLSRTAEIVSDVGLGGIAISTAWARIEAKKHYPSDVLVGMAIGHFISAFVNDTFLGLDSSLDITPYAEVSGKGMILSIGGHY